MPNPDEGAAVMLYLLGRSLVGVRAEELIALGEALKARAGVPARLVPHGGPCISAAHAYALRRDLFTGVDCLRRPSAWADAVRKSAKVPFAQTVFGALLDYDWPDLLR